MTVRAILDVSALLGYASFDRAMPVAEFIRMVGEENEDTGAGADDRPVDVHQVGVPAAAFVDAYVAADSEGRSLLADLAADVMLAQARKDPTQSSFAILPLTGADVLESGELEGRWPGRGQAILLALQHDAELATFEPPQPPPEGVHVTNLGDSWDDVGSIEMPE